MTRQTNFTCWHATLTHREREREALTRRHISSVPHLMIAIVAFLRMLFHSIFKLRQTGKHVELFGSSCCLFRFDVVACVNAGTFQYMHNKGNKHQISVRYIFIRRLTTVTATAAHVLWPTRRMRNVCKYISSIFLACFASLPAEAIDCAPSCNALWACKSVPYSLSVSRSVWGLISHNKSNWLLVGYI